MGDTESPIKTAEEQELIDSADAIPPGSKVERSSDGSITIAAPPEGGMVVEVDKDTEFGEQLDWIAAHEGLTADEALREVIQDKLERSELPAEWP